MKRLISLNKKNIVLCLIFPLLLTSCGEKKDKTEFIAKVNDSYLTKKDFAAAFDTTKLESSFKAEYLRNWVDREVLYQEALKDNIENDDEFKRLLEESKKELAKSFLIKKLLNNANISANQKELEKYYQDNKTDFVLFFDAYLFNIIKFKNEDKAIQFRNSAVEIGWNKAEVAFSNDQDKLSQNDNLFLYTHQFQSADLSNVIQELNPGEISIAIATGAKEYSVVQLSAKYFANDIPPLAAIRGEVEKRIVDKKKHEFLQNHIKELYAKYKIEIKN